MKLRDRRGVYAFAKQFVSAFLLLLSCQSNKTVHVRRRKTTEYT